MPASSKIIVRAKSGQYGAICGRGVLSKTTRQLARLAQPSGIFLLSSARVWRYCGRSMRRALPQASRRPILFDDREASKNLSTIESICRALVRAGADRRALLIAVGGGVVGDIAGFAAAAYLRGVRLVHIPTTLVAQVDSAIGGKTGVNLPEGKNLVGAFYPPELVVADSALLRTLPAREFRSGLYEVIKYGVIGDSRLFESLERNIDTLSADNAAALSPVIARCVAAKAKIVSEDERESGPRELLNFGHTFGHALESVTHYKAFRHGEAVGWGMIAASLLAIVTHHLLPEDAARIIRLVRRVGLLPPLPNASAAEMLKAMRSDKKTRHGRLRFVLPRSIGRCEFGVEVEDSLVASVWQELSAVYAHNGRRSRA
ncbi:MAG TPA: 3-dehydroquinate synthase [Candidatus Acidoferrales bacterium]|nr:3-dehydroquinate synthase [Candidatus Acidoferrales bacterium]